jgi:hypothetical protein
MKGSARLQVEKVPAIGDIQRMLIFYEFETFVEQLPDRLKDGIKEGEKSVLRQQALAQGSGYISL